MNRFKKELKKRGVMLEDDYARMYGCIPCEVGHNIYVEDVYVNSEKAIVTTFYNVDSIVERMDRCGEMMPWYGEEELKMRKGW